MSTTVAGKPGLDPTLPNVSIILGGEERHLCFDYNAIVLVEKATGVNLIESAAGVQSATSLRAMLWASLLKENPKLTVDQVGAWITMHNAPGIYAALLAAWFASTADPDAGEETQTEGEAKAQASTNA
jgi:hypothetical protein